MPTDSRGYFTGETAKISTAESDTVPTPTVAAVPVTAPTPAPAVAQATVAPTVVQISHPSLDKFFQILTALEPFLLAAAAPFIKSPGSAAIVQAEAPVAESITTALSGL